MRTSAKKSVSKRDTSSSQMQPILELRPLPQDLDLERAIIGACLVDNTAFYKVNVVFKESEVFHHESHRVLFDVMQKLYKKNQPIDLLTVNDGLKKVKNNPVTMDELLKLSNIVASGANIEYHARIIYQHYMSRQLIQLSSQLIEKAYENKDIFEVYQTAYQQLRKKDPQSVLSLQTMNQALVEGKKERQSKRLIGNLLYDSDVAILFGDEGTGKSCFAYQMAQSVASGRSLFHDDILMNECEPQKVVFIDFEMQKRELWNRYSEKGLGRDFSDNFIRASIDDMSMDYDNLPQKVMDQIELLVETEKPALIVLDNITWIIDDTTDNQAATKIMKKLTALRKKYTPLSFLVIAHTPKRDTSLPLESRHLAGAKSLSNYCTNLIGISPSKLDTSMRYLKHLKCRNGFKQFTEDNVMELILSKESGSLEYEYKDTGVEKTHLMVQDMEEIKEDVNQFIVDMRNKNHSFRAIASKVQEQFSVTMTYQTVKRKYDRSQQLQRFRD